MKTNAFRTKFAKPAFKTILAGIAMAICFLSSPVIAKSYSIAIVPQLPKEITHKNWGPFIYELRKRTGLNLKLLLFNSFQEFESSFSRGEPDFVYLNPYHQLLANQKQGYRPLIRDDSNMLTGILVVSKGSSITSLEQLQNKSVAFPSPLAFGASLYMRAALSKQGIEVDPIYVKSHNNVYRSVILGTTVAGGGVTATLSAESSQIQNELNVIFRLPGVPSHPISAHPRINESITKKLIAACLDMVNTAEGKALLRAINIPVPVVAVQERDYNPLKSLNLERFIQNSQITTIKEKGGKHGG